MGATPGFLPQMTTEISTAHIQQKKRVQRPMAKETEIMGDSGSSSSEKLWDQIARWTDTTQ